MNRRDFLTGILASGAAPAIIPAGVVRAQGDKPVPSNRVTFALIGSGNMGTAGLKNVLKNPAAQVIACCDPYKERRERGAKLVDETYGTAGCAAVRDFRELLARKDLDCVEIATADHWHIPIAYAAALAGKDMYVEKPLGVSLKWGFKLRSEINKRKLVFQHGTWQRSQKHFQRAVELVHSGVLGKVTRAEAWAPGMAWEGLFKEDSGFRKGHLNCKPIPVPEGLDYDLWQGPARTRPFSAGMTSNSMIFHNSEYALGFIAGWGIHSADIAQWGLVGDSTVPVSYKGTCTYPDVFGLFDTPATWDAACRYENGLELHFMDSVTAKPIVEQYRPFNYEGTTFFGENGWVSVDRASLRASNKEWAKMELKKEDSYLKPSNGDHWGDFIACVKSRKQPLCPVETAVNGDIICHLSSAAIRTGEEVKWDAKAEKVVSPGQAALLIDRTPRAPWGMGVDIA